MKKVSWFAESIQQDSKIIKENVVSISFSNYSDKEVIFDYKGVKRPIPGKNATTGMPGVFKAEICGYPFDVEANFKFAPGFKNLVIDFAEIKNC